jgi:hypothetical protein
MSIDLLKELIKETLLDEAKKRKNKSKRKKQKSKSKKKKSKPGNPGYYKGTRASNKSMAREINKCAKTPRPKSCYDYWDADKKYDKSRKGKKRKGKK